MSLHGVIALNNRGRKLLLAPQPCLYGLITVIRKPLRPSRLNFTEAKNQPIIYQELVGAPEKGQVNLLKRNTFYNPSKAWCTPRQCKISVTIAQILHCPGQHGGHAKKGPAPVTGQCVPLATRPSPLVQRATLDKIGYLFCAAAGATL